MPVKSGLLQSPDVTVNLVYIEKTLQTRAGTGYWTLPVSNGPVESESGTSIQRREDAKNHRFELATLDLPLQT
jgi:hypothetical protein